MVIPAASSPFKQNRHSASFEHRLRMAERAFGSLRNVLVSSIEQKLPKPSYSVETIRVLRRQSPEASFLLCLGSDNLAGFHKWHRYQEILELAGLLVVERPGFSPDDVKPEILERARFIPHVPVKMSSTEARNEFAEGHITEKVSDEVAAYIKENGLYGQKK